METTTQFDLNTAIQHWRETLNQSPGLRTENIAELEAHLRDSIATLQAKGLSDEESFLVATRRLGSAPVLESEFAKVNTKEVWLDRLLWMVVGIQMFWLCSALSTSLSMMAVVGVAKGFGYQFKPQVRRWFTFPAAIFAVARLLALVSTVWVTWVLMQSKGKIFSRLLRRPFAVGLTVVAGAGILSQCGFLAHLLLLRRLPHEEFASIALASSSGAFGITLFTSLALAALTIGLARRRLRLQVGTAGAGMGKQLLRS